MKKPIIATLIGLLALGSLIFTGCGPEAFMPVGAKMNVQSIQHDTNDEYEVAVINNDNSITWEKLDGIMDVAHIYLVNGLDQAYIEHISDDSDGAHIYNIYEPANASISAGSFQSGKTTMQGQMIYSGSGQ